MRHGISGDLGFSPPTAPRTRAGSAASRGCSPTREWSSLVSLVSPYAEDRALARALHEQAGLPFIEVFVDTPVEECERRDPKGLYARARAGELPGFTGVDGDYEAPEDPELVVRPMEEPVADAVERLLAQLDEALDAAG